MKGRPWGWLKGSLWSCTDLFVAKVHPKDTNAPTVKISCTSFLAKSMHTLKKEIWALTEIQKEAMREAKGTATPQLSADVDGKSKHLINLMIDLLTTGRLSPKSFLFMFMTSQAENLRKVRFFSFLFSFFSILLNFDFQTLLRKMPRCGDLRTR